MTDDRQPAVGPTRSTAPSPATGVRIDGPHSGLGRECDAILRALPDWFGIESSIVEYTRDADTLPSFTVSVEDAVVGLTTFKIHNPHAAEVHLMAVAPEHHRRGFGLQMLTAGQDWLRGQGIEYLQVKTVGPSSSNQPYARTRAFYLAAGFRPLEELPTLWSARNPCLILVMRL